MKRLVALGGFLTLACAVAGSTGAAQSNIWDKLRRPLRLPEINWQDPCPTTQPSTFSSSPAYPRLPQVDGGPVLQLDFPSRRGAADYGSPWAAASVPWVVRSTYRGPLLIRGRQLDGTRVMRFGRGQIPGRTERRIPRASSAGARRYASVTRLRAPGCYAFQVDGVGFSRVFVFDARTTGPATIDEIVAALRTRGLPMEPGGLFHSLAFDYLVGGLTGQRFESAAGEVILWQFASFGDVHQLLITGKGQSIDRPLEGGWISAAIFCCPYADVPPPHWYRNGTALAVYLGNDPAMLRTMEDLLGEQFAGV